jgi:hypothetical protein
MVSSRHMINTASKVDKGKNTLHIVIVRMSNLKLFCKVHQAENTQCKGPQGDRIIMVITVAEFFLHYGLYLA